MAIGNYVATATPVAGGTPVSGYVVYDDTNSKAYIIPTGVQYKFTEGVSLTCESPSIVEVNPTSVKMNSLNLQTKTITPTEAQQTITPDEGYDGIGSITVNKIALGEGTGIKTVAASKEDQSFTALEGSYYKTVIVTGYTPVLESKTYNSTNPLPADVGKITPSEGYDGLSSVTISSVKLEDKTVKSAVSTTAGSSPVTKADEDAWGFGTVSVENIVSEEKTVSPSESVQPITPSTGKDVITKVTVSAIPLATGNSATPSLVSQTKEATGGYWKSFTVNPTPLAEAKIVDPAKTPQTVELGEGNIGIKGVTVSAIPLFTPPEITPGDGTTTTYKPGFFMEKVIVRPVPTETLDPVTPTRSVQKIRSTVGKYFKSLTVNGYVPKNQTKTITDAAPIAVGTTIVADADYDGLSGVTINAVKLDSVTVKGSKTDQTVTTKDPTAFGLGSVTVEGYQLKLQDKAATPTGATQNVVVDEGYDGLSKVTVNPVPLDKTNNSYIPTAEGEVKTPEAGKYFKEFDVKPVPVQDVYLVPAKETVTYHPDPGKFYNEVTVQNDAAAVLQTKTVTPEMKGQTLTPDEGYEGFASVVLNPIPLDDVITVQSKSESQELTPSGYGFRGVTVTGDANLKAENIKENVEILDVKGTYIGKDPGDYEVGFRVGDWVALDLPLSITKKGCFRATPYYKGHYLGKTFDGGSYMAVEVYNKWGKIITTVLINDIFNKLYLEKIENKEYFQTKPHTLTISEDVRSSELDWSKIVELNGFGNKIIIDEAIELSADLTIRDSNLVLEGITTNPFSLKGNKLTLASGSLGEYESWAVENSSLEVFGCNLHGDLITSKNSKVLIEKTTLEGKKGLEVSGGEVTLRGNTFRTSEVAVDLVGDADKVSLEGNMFRSTGGEDLIIENSFVKVESIYIIGSFELYNDKYLATSNGLVINPKGTSTEETIVKFWD